MSKQNNEVNRVVIKKLLSIMVEAGNIKEICITDYNGLVNLPLNKIKEHVKLDRLKEHFKVMSESLEMIDLILDTEEIT